MMLCSGCGAGLAHDARFCSVCGRQVDRTYAPQDNPYAPPRPWPPDAPVAGDPAPEPPALEPPATGTQPYAPPPPMPVADPVREPDGFDPAVLAAPAGSHGDSLPVDATFVERVLGGDWRPALWVVLPSFAAAVAAAVVTSLSQLLTATSLFTPTVVQFAPRDIGAWFHAVPQLLAMAFGSPRFESLNGETFLRGNTPLTVTVVTVAVFAWSLRRRCADRSGRDRTVLAVRSVVLLTASITAIAFAATSTAVVYYRIDGGGSSVFGVRTTFTVSPGRVLGWSLLVLTVTALAVAGRPVSVLARRVPRLRVEDWRLPWFGALVATATSVLLGYLAALITGFVEAGGPARSPLADRGDWARLLPASLGHGVDLGVNGWTVSVLGRLGDDRGVGGDVTLSLFDRHGLSAWYIAVVVVPVLGVAAAAVAMRRRYGASDARDISRACYRMSLPIAGLYLVLAIPSRAQNVYVHGASDGVGGHVGPQVLLGTALVLGSYLVLGFVAGRVVLAAAPHEHAAPVADGGTGWPVDAYAGVSGAGYEEVLDGSPKAYAAPRRAGVPHRRRRRSLVNPVVVGAVAVVVAIGGSVGAVLLKGGRSAPGAPTASPSIFGLGDPTVTSDGAGSSGDPSAIDPSSTDPSSGGSSSPGDVAAQDASARTTLNELSTAQESYFAGNSTYASDTFDLDSYTEPDDVLVTIEYATTSGWCATATGLDDAAAYFTFDSEVGSVTEGDNC